MANTAANPRVHVLGRKRSAGLKSLRENWVLYQGTTLVVPQLLENIAGL
jgi:hypothetical protein